MNMFSLLLAFVALSGSAGPAAAAVVSADRQPVTPVLIKAGAIAELAKGSTIVVVDARRRDLFEQGHWPGAIHWPPELLSGVSELEPLRRRLADAGISGAETVVLCGDPEDPSAVGLLFWTLEWAGTRQVRILDGPLPEGLESGPEGRRQPAGEFLSPPRDVALDAPRLESLLGRDGVQILDARAGWGPVRTKALNDSYEAPQAFHDGHVPHALPVDLSRLISGRGAWPSADAVRTEMAALGPRPGDPIEPGGRLVVYDEGGESRKAALAYALLRIAGLDAALYPGGWMDWSGAERPIARIVEASEVAEMLKVENPGLALDDPPRRMILLDLREDWDFRRGHLPGAYLLSAFDFQERSETVLSERWPAVDRSQVPLVLYCYGNHCTRSWRVAAWAARLGFKNLLWFREGIDGWEEFGLPLARPRENP